MNSQSLHVSKSSHGFRSFHVHTPKAQTFKVQRPSHRAFLFALRKEKK